MTTSEEYRRYAEECFRLARDAEDAVQQQLFLEMANIWLQEAALTNRTQAVPSLATKH